MHRYTKWNPLRWLGWGTAPIRKNGAFFCFMFALGYLCTQTEIPLYPKNAQPYALAVPELLFDLFVVCCLLALLPRALRYVARAVAYVVLYGTALADTFCYVRFESTLTPTMLMLAGETTQQEATEFLSSYIGWDLIATPVGWVMLVALLHLLWTLVRRLWSRRKSRILLPRLKEEISLFIGALIGGIVLWAAIDCGRQCWDNKVALHRLFSCDTIGQVEHELTRKDCGKLYVPVYRLAFGLYANRLAGRQAIQLAQASEKIVVDSCSYRVPNIVLVIGESYNKHHSQLYGYDKPTTPRQKALQEEGSLVAFSDVVAPWNLTSFVFKHALSLHAVGDSGEWCDAPLLPEVFRRAGYHVTFITNQFQSRAKEAVFDFSGGFFLNREDLSNRLFDTRNTRLYPYDDGVLKAYDTLKKENGDHNLTILHLMGSHVDYRGRYPQRTRSYFRPAMYQRPELSDKQKAILAHYDNSLRYNDSIVAEVTQRFAQEDALVIYMPDHGEEIFDGPPYMYGRMHAAEIDYRLARNEMEIPFWIWGSPKYRENHPYGWAAIEAAKDRPMMTDVLPHLLLYLGGIATPLYRSEYNVISPKYNMKRPRILKGVTDYNTLKRP